MVEVAATDFDRLWANASEGDPSAMAELGREYARRNDYGQARRWLKRAGKAGNGAGFAQLGLLAIKGLGMSEDPAAARDWFNQAADCNDPLALDWLATFAWRDGDTARALDLTRQSARLGYPPALRHLGLLYIVSGDPAGRMLLEAAACGNDLPAMSALTVCHFRGLGGDVDLSAAQTWADRAARAGSYCREHFAPIGNVRDATLVPSIDDVAIPDHEIGEFVAAGKHTHGTDQRVTVFDQLLHPLEAEYLIELSAPLLRPSHTVHPETGEAVRNEMRTSHGFSFHPSDEDVTVLNIKQRITDQTDYPLSHAEPFAMLRYRPGQQYQPHFDYIDPDSGEAGREIAIRGQRQITIFSYLTDVEKGGATHFPRRDVTVEPRQGRGLKFHNVGDDGLVDASSLHASLPVEVGEKWIATLWIRDKAQ